MQVSGPELTPRAGQAQEPATHDAGWPGFTVRPQGGGASTIYGGSSRWVRLRQTIVWRGLGQQAGEVSVFRSLSFGAPREGLRGHLSPKARKFLRAAHVRSLGGQKGHRFSEGLHSSSSKMTPTLSHWARPGEAGVAGTPPHGHRGTPDKPHLLTAAGSPGSIPHHEALGRCPGLLVGGGLHVHLEYLAVHDVGQLRAQGCQAVCPRACQAHQGLARARLAVTPGLTYSSSRFRMWSMASSTFSGSPVTVTQLGSGAPLCGKRMST